MAKLYTDRSMENEEETALLRFLSEQLPDDYLVVGDVKVGDGDQATEIEAVVIKETAVFTITTRTWHGPIKGEFADKQVQVGDAPMLYPNPVRQAVRQTKRLIKQLRQPEQSRTVFGDPRIGLSLFVIPLIIFTHPDADIQVESDARIKLLRLEDAADAITNPTLQGRHCHIQSRERERLARLLLGAGEQGSGEDEEMGDEGAGEQTVLLERPRIFHQSLPDDDAYTMPAQPPAPAGKSSRRSLLSGVMGWMTDLPTRAEKTAEGLEGRLAGQQQGRLSNTQLARAIERQMERTINHLLQGTVAHNQYVAGLATADFDQFFPLRERMEEELAHHIQEIANARDYDMEGELQIELTEMAALRPGECEVRSFIQKTAVTQGSTPYLELAGNGKRFQLGKQVNRIGRSRENDICTDNMDRQKIVSRQHAEIRREDGGYLLCDRGSSRGTFLNGQRLNGQGVPLHDGDRFILGPTQRVDGKRPLQGSLMFVFRQR